MNKHFKVLGFISDNVQNIKCDTDSVGLLAKTDFTCSQDSNDKFMLASVGEDFVLEVTTNDKPMMRVKSMENECDIDYAKRIVELIKRK